MDEAINSKSASINTLQIILSFLPLMIFFVFSFDYSLSTFIFHDIFPYDQKRIVQLFTLISGALFFYLSPHCRTTMIEIIRSSSRLIKIAISIFFILGIFSAGFSKLPFAGFLEWSLYALLVLYALFWCALALRIGKQFYFMLSALIFFVILIYTYPVMTGYVDAVQHHEPIYFFPFFMNIRFFSQFAVFTIPLLPLADIWLALKSKPILKYTRILFFLLAGFWWGLILINGSRALIYSFIISTLFAFIIFQKKLFPWVWRQACFIFLGVLAVYLLTTIPHFSQNKNLIYTNLTHIHTLDTVTTQSRIGLYQYTFQLIAAHPIFGVGPMHFAYAPPNALITSHDLAAQPHNFILLIFSEWGIPAGIALLFLICRMLFNFIRTGYLLTKNSQQANHTIIFASFMMSLFAGLLSALVSGVTVMPLSQTMLAIITGCCIALYYQDNGIFKITNGGISHLAYTSVISVVIGFSILVVVYSLWTTLPYLEQSEIYWLQTQKHGLQTQFNPRFWVQGWLTNTRPI